MSAPPADDRHLHNAARVLREMLSVRDPSRVWTVEVLPKPDDADAVGDGHAPAPAAALDADGLQQAA
jgi:hypothetical protein